jgi:hypothetical protein
VALKKAYTANRLPPINKICFGVSLFMSFAVGYLNCLLNAKYYNFTIKNVQFTTF